VVFPEDTEGFAVDDQYYIGGEGVLVKPVTSEGAVTTDVYISDNQVCPSSWHKPPAKDFNDVRRS
jgi:alpha 1,3-glucosidase